MRRTAVKTTSILLSGAVLMSAAGCGGSSDLSAGRADGGLRLIFIAPVIHEEFFQPVRKGMEDAAGLMGVEATFTGTEGVDTKAQAAMVAQAVKDGYDGIAVDIIHETDFDDVVAGALKAGVPVVAFNTDDTTDNPRLSTVSQDLYQAGRTVATRAVEIIPKGTDVLITKHDEGITALDERARGIQDVLKKHKIKWKVVITTPHPHKAAGIIAKTLKDDPRIRTVLATGQADTEGAGLALEREFAGKGYTAAGFDLSPNTLRLIDAGVIRFTIDQQPYIQGFYPVIQLALLLRYGIKPADIDAGAAVITKAEARSVMKLKARNYR